MLGQDVKSRRVHLLDFDFIIDKLLVCDADGGFGIPDVKRFDGRLFGVLNFLPVVGTAI